MIKFDVLNRITGSIQFTAEIDCDENSARSYKLGLAVKWAIKAKVDLSYADLRYANLSYANLSSADLISADLRSADLSSADLRYANLSYANLSSADLSSADLIYADLRSADLRSADLSSADLISADLRSANLSYADLRYANLSYANLSSADLISADLSETAGSELAIAQTRILPDGDLIGWKKCRNGVIVKLRIPADAKRSHAFGRKCRAEFADVLEVIGADVGISSHDGETSYRAGERVTPDRFDEKGHEECAGGIHFFITRIEAEKYN